MLSLYALPTEVLVLCTVLLVPLMCCRILLCYMDFLERREKKSFMTPIHELMNCAFVAALIYISIVALRAISNGEIASFAYHLPLFLVLLVVSGVLSVVDRRAAVVDGLMAAFLAISFNTVYFGKMYLLCVLWLTASGLICLALEVRRARYNLTVMSINEAFDVLPDGILFTDKNSEKVLINRTMRQMLDFLGFKYIYEPRLILEQLSLGESQDYQSISTEDGLLLRIRNGGSWLMTAGSVSSGVKVYNRLSAVDVTGEDSAAIELQEINDSLLETSKKLQTAIYNIDKLENTRQILKLKSGIHDVLGQRLSILHRFLENINESKTGLDDLRPMLENISEDLEDSIKDSPQEQFATFQKTGELIDVSLELRGELPSDNEAAKLFLRIIRECTTNAVAHAKAGRVVITTTQGESSYAMTVENDGNRVQSIKEGDGIRGMRRRVEDAGGHFEIKPYPIFTVSVSIPRP